MMIVGNQWGWKIRLGGDAGGGRESSRLAIDGVTKLGGDVGGVAARILA